MSGAVYRGDRTIDGAEVTVDGDALDPRYDIRSFEPRGFEWSYEGDGPRQLALAILAHHFDDGERALAETERFMERVVANFGNEWEMSAEDIERALENIREGA